MSSFIDNLNKARKDSKINGKNWNFTVFETDGIDKQECVRKLKLFKSGHDFVNYICWGEEVCPTTGKDHFQGYLQLNRKVALTALKKAMDLPQVHLEIVKNGGKRTAERARNYTAKEGGVWEEYGDFRGCVPAPRTEDIQPMDVINDMRGGIEEAELVEKWGEYYLRKKGQLRESIKDMQNDEAKALHKERYNNCKLKAWQEEAILLLTNQSDREILFISDEAGNSGKSWLAGYLHTKWGAMYTNSTAYKDVMYAFNHQEYAVFDLCRDHVEHANYGIMEAMKNGRAFSGKYSSGERVFKPCKVVVFMNKSPDYSKLSADRYQEKTPIMLGEERLLRERRNVQEGISRKRQLSQDSESEDEDILSQACKVAKIAPGYPKNETDVWMQPQDKALHQQFDGVTDNPPIFVIEPGAEYVGEQEIDFDQALSMLG